MSRQDQSGPGVIGVIGVLFVVGMIVKYIWWILGGIAIVAAFFITDFR